MILNIKLKGGMALPVKAHRVLSERYPKLELYAHFGVNEGEKQYQKNTYCISDKNGLAIAKFNYFTLKDVIKHVIERIDFHGEDKVALQVKLCELRLNST
jgi:hypothetical protein